jgi:hypothetical protein
MQQNNEFIQVPDCEGSARRFVTALSLFNQLHQDDVLRAQFKLTADELKKAEETAKKINAQGTLMAPLGEHGLLGFCVFRPANAADAKLATNSK